MISSTISPLFRRKQPIALWILILLSLVLLSHSKETDKWKPRKDETSHADLFSPCPDITVLGPAVFPKPNHKLGNNVSIIVEPTYGHHRPEQDAVLAYAEGYRLSYYMMFMETLTTTGFRGDVVLAIAEESIIRPQVLKYLLTFTSTHGSDTESHDNSDKPNLVIYQEKLRCDLRHDNKYGDPINGTTRQVLKSGDTDVFQFCQLPNVYGWYDHETGHVGRAADDPREGRVVATIRYEWYWIWASQYQANSWLMLIDARDSYFQSNPFADLPRNDVGAVEEMGGLLYFFGENTNATRLGISKKNQKWIRKGYGGKTMQYLRDKPTICSGSTMGEQVAVESYLRAMVNEHDEANVRMTGSDQGFHNYLYYSGKLRHAAGIRKLVVWEQGRGIINNLGALRTMPLREWGILDPDTKDVYQWDGATLSPVVHQWDRDQELHRWMWNTRHADWNNQWIAEHQ